MSGFGPDSLIPARTSDWFTAGFTRYVRRLLRKRFHSVRIAHDGLQDLEKLAKSDRPAVILLNHSSWWDPLVAVLASSAHLPGRRGIAPIDSAQLKRFGFFRRIGMFGIDPDSPESMQAMRTYVLDCFRKDPRLVLWLTPQGRFTDVRDPIRIRPGAAGIASAHGDLDVLSLSIEYCYWQESRAEVLMRASTIEAPGEPSTASWQRAMTSGMQQNSDVLAELVRSREDSSFQEIVGDRARTSFFYDLMLRARGRGGEIAARRGEDRGAARA